MHHIDDAGDVGAADFDGLEFFLKYFHQVVKGFASDVQALVKRAQMIFTVVAHWLAQQIGHELDLVLDQAWLVHDVEVMPQIGAGIHPLVKVGDYLAEGGHAAVLVEQGHAMPVIVDAAGFAKPGWISPGEAY